MCSVDHRERETVFQVNIFSGSFCLNKTWMMPLNIWENVSLAIVLELQIVQENDEVTYSTEVIARHKEKNILVLSFSSYSLSLSNTVKLNQWPQRALETMGLVIISVS